MPEGETATASFLASLAQLRLASQLLGAVSSSPPCQQTARTTSHDTNIAFAIAPLFSPNLPVTAPPAPGGVIFAIVMAPEQEKTGKAGVIVAPDDANPMDKLVRSREAVEMAHLRRRPSLNPLT
jgi:hypothetical protein